MEQEGGEESLSEPYLIEAFKLYIPSEEKEFLDKALIDFQSDDEDLLDFLGNLRCNKVTTQKKPRYITDCLMPTVIALRKYNSFQTLDELEAFYKDKKPSSKKIIKLQMAGHQTSNECPSLHELK